MAHLKLCILIAVSSLFVLNTADAALEVVNGKIKITTVSTSGCGDTVRFITQQLAPTYAAYKEFIELEFIPWGRTKRNEDGSLTCQFGPKDCLANRIHRCTINILKSNQDAQMNYMNCEFTSPYPAYGQGSYRCAEEAGVSLVDLDYCVNTSGEALDLASEAAATAPMQAINFVPSIVFNDEIDVSIQAQARSNLKSLVCFALASDPSTGVTNCQL